MDLGGEESLSSRSDRRRSRRWLWALLGATTLATAVLLVLLTLGMVLGRAFVTVNAGELPIGHPYEFLDGGEASISCTTLVGYVAGDRDPLCQNDIRVQGGVVAVSAVAAVGFAALSMRCWRRWRRSSLPAGPSTDRPRSTRVWLVSYRASVIMFGVVVLALGAAAAGLGPNGGSWENTKVIPPAVPGLSDWRARTGPLIGALANETKQIGSAVGQNDSAALGAACNHLVGTAAELSAAAVPAPDPELDRASRQAVASTNQAAQACKVLTRPGNVELHSLELLDKLLTSSIDWGHAVDDYIRLKVGPGS